VPDFRFQLAHDADVVVEFEVAGAPPSVVRYSVVLRHIDGASNATAVRVYDNSHDPAEHHMHRCDATGNREQSPELFPHGEAYEALQEARKLVENGFEEMIAGWRR
jgi:hypothetical protein